MSGTALRTTKLASHTNQLGTENHRISVFTQGDVVLHYFVNKTFGSADFWMQEGAVTNSIRGKVQQQVCLIQLGGDLQQFLL